MKQVIKALRRLGASYANAYRIYHSKGQACKMLVRLIEDLIERGIEIR